MRIPLFDTEGQIAQFRGEIDGRIAAVVDSGRFVLGPEVERFEQELAAFLGTSHVVGVANGTDALTIALKALGVGPGDEVVVPSFTFYATAEAVVNAGGRPVFCDIDPDTFCITAETVERVLTDATRAVVPVHLFGTPAPMDELRALASERRLRLLEDSAQAAGAMLDGRRAGALGDAATFSFFPSKNLFCLGDGGAIATGDADVASRARLLRLHGSADKQTYEAVGFNSRLDELQAAVLRAALPRLDGWNEARRRLASAYAAEGIADLVEPARFPAGAVPVHHMYVVRSERREQALAGLTGAGVAARACYPVPLHRQPAMAPYGHDARLPGTDVAAATSFALPMAPTLGPDAAGSVVEALRQSLNSP